MQIKDGEWLLVSYDHATGKSTWRKEEPNGGYTLRSDQPVDSLIEQNKLVRNTQGKLGGDWVKVASIPANIVWDSNLGLIDAFNAEDNKYISRFLNDSDNRAWRTSEHSV